MSFGSGLLIVASNPVVGREKDYHEWYAQHLMGSLDRFPGMLSAQRFERLHDQDEESRFNYLAVYEVDDADLVAARDAVAAVRAERLRAASAGLASAFPRSEAMARPHIGLFYRPISLRFSK